MQKFSKLVSTGFVSILMYLFAQQLLAQPQYGAVGEFYTEVCSACHGANLEGTNLGTPLVGIDLKNGHSIEQIKQSIAAGNLETGMPAFANIYNQAQIQSLAIYILEQRAGFDYDSYQMREVIHIPEGIQQTQLHDFVLTTLTDEVDPLPYSIVPMPNGQTLLVEKKIGLSIISADGEKSELIRGTPKVWDDSSLREGLRALDRGKGWMQDVVLHPDYENNGWIYIYYGDRCDDCNELSVSEGRPAGMTKIVRGRINNGEWIDQQIIWQTGYENYTTNTDLAIAGRMTLSADGYVYFAIGAMNGFYDPEIQSLSRPWGKIHRVHDDGRIPADNPFVGVDGAIESIWSYGHRVPQGLDYDNQMGTLWSSEHGARGGDEINRIEGGNNYGWPYVTNGVDYDGSSIREKFDIEIDMAEITLPVVDITPSPAISSIIVYQGDQFPEWQGNILAGSLKAQTLYRFAIEDNQLVQREALISGIGRIRDIEVDAEGYPLLLIENAAGGRVLRINPANP